MAREATAAPGVVRTPRGPEDIVVWSDEQLLRQFLSRSGESAEAAFAALIERHGPVVRRVCLDILRDPDESRDAAQSVFLVLARKAGSIRKPGSLGPWLHGVALRVARRVRSDTARRRAAERGKAEMIHRRPAAEPGPEPIDDSELHEEIDRLPEKYRQPIILFYMQGRTQSQVAETLGWPLGTVQVRLHRGRARLRSGLTHRGVGLIIPTLSALLAPTPATADAPGREWTETTARAAVRSASGRGGAGLVAPAVAELAECVLKSMLDDSSKVVAFMAIALLLAAVGLSSAGGPRDGVAEGPGPIRTAPTPEATPREAPAPVVVEDDLAAARPGRAREGSDEHHRPMAPPPDPSADRGIFEPPASPGRSPGSAPVGPRPERTPSRGRELFERRWVKDDRRGHGGDGLGPVFNGQSCVECHNLGGSGGAGGVDRNIEIATVTEDLAAGGYSYAFSMDFEAGRFEYRLGANPQASPSGELRVDRRFLTSIHPGFGGSRSVVLHRYGTDPAYRLWRESLPGQHGSASVRTSQRNPPPLFGVGAIDAIPDEVIEAAVRRKFPGSAQVKGRAVRLRDGRIGRFGWKAQTATLEEFVRSAASGELGLEIPGRRQASDPRLPGLAAPGLDMDEGECQDLIDHVRSLPSPVAIEPPDDSGSAQIKAGEATFKSIGCTGCHLPRLGEVEGIYSDLLVHDMGPQPGNADAYTVFVGEPPRGDGPAVADHPSGTGAASAREWRTPPLWGLRDSGPYMHDGRAARIDQAVALHAGQGEASARRYAELSARRKRQIEAFLMSLAAPPEDR